VRSLTVLEPPATRVAAGHPAADRFAREGEAWWRDGPREDPEAFLRGFLDYVGSAYEPPSPLPPAIEQGARTLIVERGPWEADVPLDLLAAAAFPTLVVSGAHHEAFDAICDVLEERLGAERIVLPGAGHNPQRVPGFNEALEEFLLRAGRA
jgi:pimeloyl-ACP methyl ester carboxylesterase